LAKTVTYEVVTAASEFGANYFFVRDLAAAAGLTTFSVIITPLVYYVHGKGLGLFRRRESSIAKRPRP
jgi:uncharacterized membrane protein